MSLDMKTCTVCSSSFQVTDRDQAFYEKISPVIAGKKFAVPEPTLCPDCRQQRRISYQNERKFYMRKCDLSGKDTVSIYSPDKKAVVYDQQEWWSDK